MKNRILLASALMSTLSPPGALNDWALANCGDDYAPVFEEYRGVIG